METLPGFIKRGMQITCWKTRQYRPKKPRRNKKSISLSADNGKPVTACFIVQMHAVALTITEESIAHTVPNAATHVFKRLITVFPYIHEIIFVDVSLRKLPRILGQALIEPSTNTEATLIPALQL